MKDFFLRASPMIVWMAMTVLGAIYLAYPKSTAPDKPAPELKASRFLANNTLLLPSDFSQKGVTGGYVSATLGLRPGASFKPEDLVDHPDISELPVGQFLIIVPISSKEVVAGINATSNALLCGVPATSYGVVTVAFVRCEAGVDSVCSALVEVSGATAQLALKALSIPGSLGSLHISSSCG